ncbi:MAG: hypothetical protein IPK03_14390 [Bacteroidetes bacterium]|nr:hypothetical protein [Bacteroidota bacterium]
MTRLISFILIIAIVDLYAFQGIKTAFENSKWKQLATYIYWGFTGFSLLFFALSTAMDFRHHGNAFTKYLFGLIVSVLIFKFSSSYFSWSKILCDWARSAIIKWQTGI